jgi:hypothetical protein
MAAHFLAGYNRKKTVLVCLLPISIVTMGLSLVIGLSEVSLPLNTQVDELRLINPDFAGVPTESNSGAFFETPEDALVRLANCRETAVASCSGIVRQMLQNRPADGRLWLEYARGLTLENGLDEKALEALNRSYELAPREGWLKESRTGFALSVWAGLSKELQDKAAAEVVTGISNYQYANFLADFYVDRLLSRKVIGSLLEAAPVADQRRVLSLINAKTKV